MPASVETTVMRPAVIAPSALASMATVVPGTAAVPAINALASAVCVAALGDLPAVRLMLEMPGLR